MLDNLRHDTRRLREIKTKKAPWYVLESLLFENGYQAVAKAEALDLALRDGEAGILALPERRLSVHRGSPGVTEHHRDGALLPITNAGPFAVYGSLRPYGPVDSVGFRGAR